VSRGHAERLDRQRGRVRGAARRLRLAEAEALAALDSLRAELALTVDRDEGYGLALDEVAAVAGLDEERAGRMVAAHPYERAGGTRQGGRRRRGGTVDPGREVLPGRLSGQVRQPELS